MPLTLKNFNSTVWKPWANTLQEVSDYYNQTKSAYQWWAKGWNSTPEEEKKEEKEEKEQVIILDQIDNGSWTGDVLKL